MDGTEDEAQYLFNSPSPTTSSWGEWVRMLTQDGFLQVLRQMATQGELNRSNIRSVCWKLFLAVLSEDRRQWVVESEKSRQLYKELKAKHFTDPHCNEAVLDVANNNPLSQNEDSPWNQFFKDNDLMRVIEQDVVRTFPEVEFFKGEDVRSTMKSILLCYAKEHPEIGYRQGMHELLAPVLFVMAIELRENIQDDPTLSPELKVVMDPTFTEHDSFTIFSEIMEYVSPWYISEGAQNLHISAAKLNKWFDLRSTEPFQKGELNHTSALSKKVEKIQFVLLKKVDSELHLHLSALDIIPQVYGIRWIRLLFGREFPFPSVLELWDAIFADKSAMSLVEYICVAMLVLIRKKLMLCDGAGAMQLLMLYPWSTRGYSSTWDINDLVQMAFHFRKPDLFELPVRAQSLFLYSEFQEPLHLPPSHTKLPVSSRDRPPPPPTGDKGHRFRSKLTNFIPRPGGTTRQQQHPPPVGRSSPRTHRPPQQSGQSNTLPPLSPSKTTQPRPSPRLQHQQPRPPVGKQGSPARPQRKGATNSSNAVVVLSPTEHHPFGEPQELRVNPPQSVVPANSLMERVEMLEVMCSYCGEKMESYLNVLQDEVQSTELSDDSMEKIFVKLAELKQIRDLLQGKLPFAGVLPAKEQYDHHGNTEDGNAKPQQSTPSEGVTPQHTPSQHQPPQTDNHLSNSDNTADSVIVKPGTDCDDQPLSDQDELAFDVGSKNLDREALLKAVFEDNGTSPAAYTQTNNCIDHSGNYDDKDDDWVAIDTDELV